MKQTKRRLIICAAIALCSLLLLHIPLSFWIVHPVRALTRYARAIRDGQEAQRPTFSHKDEIAELAIAFEEMREALEGKQYVEGYVQSLTHEMKSPLASIQGAVELLSEEMPAERRAHFLSNIRAESDRLHDLVVRMLSLASIEKQNGLNHTESISIQALVDDVIDSLAPVAQKKNVSFHTNIAPNPKLQGEYFLLRQAVSNLVSNAIEFSPTGGVIELEAIENQLVVRDSGVGITETALKRVFERFYSVPRASGGLKSSGLGLNFVQEIARLHGGSISLKNRSEGGAEAILLIPKTRKSAPSID